MIVTVQQVSEKLGFYLTEFLQRLLILNLYFIHSCNRSDLSLYLIYGWSKLSQQSGKAEYTSSCGTCGHDKCGWLTCNSTSTTASGFLL